MKICLVSNFLNHHQLPICEEFCMIVGSENFKFIATEAINQERLLLGYPDLNAQYDFCIRTYENNKEYKNAMDFVLSADVAIIGSAPKIYLKSRNELNKLTFVYSERLFKFGYSDMFNPRYLMSILRNYTLKSKHRNLYLLCSSGYAPWDFSIVQAFNKKMFKWGYFPELELYNTQDLMKMKERKVVSILWVGRFIDWKHPEKIIEMAKYLNKKRLNYKIKMIGNGPMMSKLSDSICINELSEQVEIIGSMPPDQVRKQMELANIFVMTSNFAEGWGVVLNEAMNSGCAVAVNYRIGAAPFLISNNTNGVVFDKDEEMFHIVEKMILDRRFREYLGINAYESIYEVWNAQNAANNFVKLCKGILSMNPHEFDGLLLGPCSTAKPISQGKMYNTITLKSNNL